MVDSCPLLFTADCSALSSTSLKYLRLRVRNDQFRRKNGRWQSGRQRLRAAGPRACGHWSAIPRNRRFHDRYFWEPLGRRTIDDSDSKQLRKAEGNSIIQIAPNWLYFFLFVSLFWNRFAFSLRYSSFDEVVTVIAKAAAAVPFSALAAGVLSAVHIWWW